MDHIEEILNRHLPRPIAVKIIREIEAAEDDARFSNEWQREYAAELKRQQRQQIAEAVRLAAESCPY